MWRRLVSRLRRRHPDESEYVRECLARGLWL